MIHCELGNTDMKASEIGLGCEGFTNEILHVHLRKASIVLICTALIPV